jgi:hypothetical protein
LIDKDQLRPGSFKKFLDTWFSGNSNKSSFSYGFSVILMMERILAEVRGENEGGFRYWVLNLPG